jgi:two-component system sensor kinase FixL
LFGYTKEDIAGKNVKIMMPSPFSEDHDHYLENYRKTGKAKVIGIGRGMFFF